MHDQICCTENKKLKLNKKLKFLMIMAADYKVTYKYLLTKPYNSLKEIKTLHYWRKQTESLAQKVIT